MSWTNSMQRTSFLKRRRHRNISLLSRSLLVEISSSSSSSDVVIGASSQHHSSITLMPSIRAMYTTFSNNGTRCQRILMKGCTATSCSSSRRYSKATCSSQVTHNISSFFDVHHCNTINMLLVGSSNSTSHFTSFNRQFYTQTYPQYDKKKTNEDISSSSLNDNNRRE